MPIPSYRVKLATARRLLNKLLDEERQEGIPTDVSFEIASKRRALSILLGQLMQNAGGIRALEIEAKRRLSSERYKNFP